MAEQIPFSVAANLLMKLGSDAFAEIGLMYGVRKEMTKLKDTLEAVKARLLDAEEQEQQKTDQDRSRIIALWIRRLKDVVYDADDLLDDFATEDLRRRTDVQGGQVRDFFSSSNHIAFRFKMGHRIKDIRERLDGIANDMSKFNFTPRVIVEAPRVGNRGRETHSGLEKCHEIVGRDENTKEIVELLKQSSARQNLSVVVIVGMGGLGKTTLAQLVYNDHGLVNYFDMKMWVCVSDNFDVKLLIRNIIKSATEKDVENLELDQLQKLLQSKLDRKRYLLVLDDVWNEDTDKWDKLRNLLPDVTNGSKILMTTRSTKVAAVMGINHPYTLEGLDEEMSWNLFTSLAFKQGQENLRPKLVTIAKEIVKMCKGIPLVIKTLGRMLSSEIREDKWLRIRNNENLMSLDQDEKFLSVLKLSYDALPVHLKQCFTYCALFPKDHIIEKDLLIQLWMAQGYIQSSSGGSVLEDVGEQYFEELLWRSFFQETEEDDDGNIISCKMHDIIHDLAESLVINEISILTDESNKISERVHHVSVIGRINYQELFRAKSIRTFIRFANDCEVSLGNPLVKIRCQNLRALDLGGLPISTVPKCFGKLSHLRYLDLSNGKFDELPKFITRLQNLQTLKLLWCGKLKELPTDMGNLINLRHLLIDHCDSLGHMPSGLGELTELQTLPFFVVGKGSGDSQCNAIGSLSELKRLNNLRGELEIRNLENVRDAAVVSKRAILVEKQYLQSLDLEWEVDMEANNRSEDADQLVMEGLLPNSNLKELYISGYAGVMFPSWMTKDGLNLLLPNVVKITIYNCKRCRYLPLLDQLPSLKYLELMNLSEMERPMESSSTIPFFPSLETLIIHTLRKWKGWWRRGVSFPCLSRLEIWFCHKLTSFGQSSFPCLEKLKLRGVSKKLLAEPLFVFSSLKNLSIGVIDDLMSLPEERMRCLTSLNHLEIEYCSSLKSLSPGIQHLIALTDLKISGCTELDFPDNEYTDMLFQGLGSLHSLTFQQIPKLVRLPKALQHVTTLETLSIVSCHAFDTLPDWIATFTLLTSLELSDCEQLKSVPGGISSMGSLEELRIWKCPYLKEMWQKETGEGWPDISHIPIVRIEGELILNVNSPFFDS